MRVFIISGLYKRIMLRRVSKMNEQSQCRLSNKQHSLVMGRKMNQLLFVHVYTYMYLYVDVRQKDGIQKLRGLKKYEITSGKRERPHFATLDRFRSKTRTS